MDQLAQGLVDKVVKQVIKSEAKNVSQIPQKGCNFNELEKKIRDETNQAKSYNADEHDRRIQAFFLGPRGQNVDFFSRLIQKAINSHLAAREEYEMEDYRHITRKIKSQESFMNAQDNLENALTNLLTKLKDLTPPFFSSRYFGHMIWETTIPSIVANFATILYNPNNCAFQASPITTLLQIQVLTQFATMFGYPPMLSFSTEKTTSDKNSWGHLTCGGTIANCQALWAARNCRFLALSVKKYIESLPADINHIKQIKVKLANGTEKKLLDLTGWQILNVSNEQGTNVYDLGFQTLHGGNADKYGQYQKHVSSFSIGERGLLDMYDWIHDINDVHKDPVWGKKIPKPIVLGSATAHYSLKKSLSILGLGKDAYQSVVVDLDSRVCISALDKRLHDCLQKRIPVLAVIAIVGTTEQSTVDSVVDVIRLRQQYAKKGLYFHVHIDGAYGAYFVSMIRNQFNQLNSYSLFVKKQLQAFCHGDSITFDPHKTGYVPYSCGGIIYRNHRLRDNLSFSAPYIYTGAEPNMAIYGIEGSKPGSSVSSVYLSLQVLPLVRGGHGSLLERTLKNTKVFTASLYTVKDKQFEYKYEKGVLVENFQCFLLPRLTCQKNGHPEFKEEELKAISFIAEQQITELQTLLKAPGLNDYEKYYYSLGPDLNIVCFGLNFNEKIGGVFKPNRSLKKYNQFNRAFIKLSKPVGSDISVRMKDLYVSQTEINRNDYGAEIFDDFLKRHNLIHDGQDTIVLIRSTIMNAFFTEVNADKKREPPNQVFVRQLMENGCETLLYLGWR